MKQIISGISGQIPNYQPTAAENTALDTIMKNAQGGNPYTPQIQSLATDLLGGGPDRSGIVNDAYSNYQKQAQPYLDPSYLDPASNPHFNAYSTQLADDAASRVNQMFAGAGRDMSGAHMQTLGKGITEATLPVYANQYNQNVATQRGLMDNMFAAGGQTAGLLSGLDQTALGNRQAGVGAADAAQQSQNSGANSVLQAEAMRRGLPLSNLQGLSSLLLPIAGLGSQSSGTTSSVGSQTMSPVQQAMGWTQAFNNLMPKAPVKF
ncbi:MAG: tail fiber domain-containing protein [Nitrospiraceae bacterium]